MKKLLLLVLLFSVFISAAMSAEVKFPSPKGFVNDFAGVLDQGTVQKMEGLCKALEAKTSAEMAIAVVKTVSPLDSKLYAVKLFENWKIGKKGKDNGILVLLAMEERRAEIEVGYGLEGVINDAKAGEILDKYAVPYFKEGKFGDGLYNTAAAIAEKIAEKSGQEMGDEYNAETAKGEGFKPDDAISVGIVILMILTVFVSGLIAGIVGAIIIGIVGFIIGGPVGAIIGAIIGFVLSYFPILRGARWFGGWGGGMGGGWSSGGGGGGFGGGSSGGGGSGRSW